MVGCVSFVVCIAAAMSMDFPTNPVMAEAGTASSAVLLMPSLMTEDAVMSCVATSFHVELDASYAFHVALSSEVLTR